ncbi:MAG: protein-methionine-sulfoxide reductase catalytic subunit MsrP, partial [Rhodospirillaceae bacterium]
MLFKSKKSWEIPESQVTEEKIFLKRRQLIKSIAAGSVLLPSIGLHSRGLLAQSTTSNFSAARNLRYRLDREVTDEKLVTSYNNFYEFGSHKEIASAAQALKVRPWQVIIDGMVEKQQVIGVDDLFRKFQFEERLYRFRCVEAWSMALPWTGFPLAELVKIASPRSGAKYLVMETFKDPKMARGQRQFWYPWPYLEALTLEEATNELAFIATGVFGKEIPKQMGAPLRLVVPWKYGFKSIKSIVRFTFSDKRPTTFWERIQPGEYGFWANVNPDVDHPRWSQATERPLGRQERIKTLLYNGYGEQVAGLYRNMVNEQLFR